MKRGLAAKTALKFERYQIEKTEQNLSSTFTVFRTHTLSKSDAQIMLPPTYGNISGKTEDLIFLVTCGKISFYAELSENSFSDKSLTQVSILQNLVSIAGVAVDNTGHFKGEMKCLDKEKVPQNYQLEYAQILVKNMFLSRRDQYKVLKYIEDRRIHVYNRKTLYFDKLKLEFTNIMHNNIQIRKTGLMTKNTKIIFRTGCSKYTILFQISKQMFELNEDKQLFLEKAVNFLLIFFQRNNYFNNKHRIEIILFARLFYPQFKTLRQAYEKLQTDEKNIKGNVFTINYAVAFQKDGDGRIYQDAYRRLLWPSGNIAGFKEKFWERVSQFIFTINWENSKSYAKNVGESIQENIQKLNIIKNTSSFKVKPFLLRLPCELSNSQESCCFQAISIIAQQYKHHYYFRSVSETGNAITVISAGKSFYKVDETTYEMAKSNIFLTNISCVHINLRRKEPRMRVQVKQYKSKARYQKDDIKKLQNLLDWCIEEDAYRSPTIVNIEFAEDFQLKSFIFPENLKPCTKTDITISQIHHYCNKSEHFINDEQNEQLPQKTISNIEIDWISTYYMNEASFLVHNYFYDNSNIEVDFVKKKIPLVINQNDFATFQRDLKIILNKKNNYSFTELCQNSLLDRRVSRYVSAALAEQKKAEKQSCLLEQSLYEEKYGNKFFQISCLEDEEERMGKGRDRKMVMSNSNSPDAESASAMLINYDAPRHERKRSDYSPTPLDLESVEDHKKLKKTPPKVNIFQQTYRKKQYTPKMNMYRKNIQKSTHISQRLKKNYKQSNLHYMMTYFNESSLQCLANYFKRPQPHSEQESRMYDCFDMEKEWKNIVFPILTPISTNHRADLKSEQMNSKYSETGESVIQDQVCKHLMNNFQIQKENVNRQITMSKGHVHLLLSITAKDNVTLFEAVNLEKQKQIVPKVLYRYLCYEEKDYRFCAKNLMFSDENYYIKEDKKSSKKSVKLVMIEQQIKDDGQAIKQFLKLLKQKYRGMKLQLKYQKNYKEVPLQTYTVQINLVEGLKNKIYKSQKIDVTFDVSYHPDCLYQIIVEWHFCSATYVNEFIENVISSARKNKIVTHQVSKTNAFNTRWMTATIGEIIFQSRLAMDILEERIVKERNWIWDREGYYMDRNGEAFIRFNKEKYLIQWFDNTIDKAKWRKLEMENQLYEKFFMKSAAYDFLGGMIDSFTSTNSRKSSLALST